jgi:hypothetical protein
MAIYYVMNFIEDNTTLSRGVDLFEMMLPESLTEGVQVRTLQEASSDTGFETDAILITIINKNYTLAKSLSRTLFDYLKTVRGNYSVQYPFTLQGEITKVFIGQDDQRRFIFEIRLVVKHPEYSIFTTTTTTTTTTSTTTTTTTQI